ncbi:unnamed protein product [Enterobius vermicularis]|uniref:ERM domain-containing protein n=1 Tax=Enterobius vermicularis TaxID=51028 RepID=A0A0N4VQB3_ENTVE|nr:unnamed protein product [Enterobius vermicularis]
MSEPIRATTKVLVEEPYECIETFRIIDAEETPDTKTKVEEMEELEQRIIRINSTIKRENREWSQLLTTIRGDRLKEEKEKYERFLRKVKLQSTGFPLVYIE